MGQSTKESLLVGMETNGNLAGIIQIHLSIKFHNVTLFKKSNIKKLDLNSITWNEVHIYVTENCILAIK